ncbi:MAG: glycosyltransferase family 39 protein [Candidatus Moraniibacteriota bacterium]
MDTRKVFQRISPRIWILAAIVIVGVFLRTYRFSQWMYFYPDQARDVMLVGDVLSGRSSWPLLGPIAASTPFQLGPITYYFQIASGALFGVSPWSLAVPDLCFGILAIPFLFVFLKRILAPATSLALAGLYAVSFPAVRYSRFAWNSNSIPFFIILFLLSLSEFLRTKSRTAWAWVVALGVAFGVGIQLHTVLLVSLPLMIFPTIVFSIRSDPKTWKKWLAVIMIAITLNTGQIVSETRTEFQNTRYFFSVLDTRSPHESVGLAQNLFLDIVCHAQANALFTSSLPKDDTCATITSFRYATGGYPDRATYLLFLAGIAFGLMVFVAGIILAIHRLRMERDEQKRVFLWTVLTSATLTFLVMLPVVGHNGQVRYLLPVFFFPFLSLGLIAEYASRRFPGKFRLLLPVFILIILIALNVSTIVSEAQLSAAGIRSNAQYIILDELEAVRDAIISESAPAPEAYLYGGEKYMQNYLKPLIYSSSQENFTILKGRRDIGTVPAGKPVFFIAQSLDTSVVSEYNASPEAFGLTVESYRGVGNIGIYGIRH